MFEYFECFGIGVLYTILIGLIGSFIISFVRVFLLKCDSKYGKHHYYLEDCDSKLHQMGGYTFLVNSNHKYKCSKCGNRHSKI